MAAQHPFNNPKFRRTPPRDYLAESASVNDYYLNCYNRSAEVGFILAVLLSRNDNDHDAGGVHQTKTPTAFLSLLCVYNQETGADRSLLQASNVLCACLAHPEHCTVVAVKTAAQIRCENQGSCRFSLSLYSCVHKTAAATILDVFLLEDTQPAVDSAGT